MEQLIQNLMHAGNLRTPRLIAAFRKIDRKNFVPAAMREYAYDDRPLPIGFGQTISQPEVVAHMLELLAPASGQRILDVGSGSGWQTALLAEIVGEGGEVVAVERIPELYEMGKRNCARYRFENIRFVLGDATQLREPDGSFDRIIAGAASAEKVPESFRRQLKVGGIMVVPVGESILSIRKLGETEFSEKEFPGFLFVPLVED